MLRHFDELVEDFYEWKKPNRYDERLFVKFLGDKFGEESISYVKTVGKYAGSPNIICLEGKDITEQYTDIKWFNF